MRYERGFVIALCCVGAVACSDADVPADDGGAEASSWDAAADVAPQIDAGVDAPAEAAVDTGPPPLTCPGEVLEPNDSEILASVRPQIDDCDSSGQSFTGVSSGTGDVDWVRFRGKDTTLCAVDPTLKIDAAGVRICAFVMCTDGATTVQGCTNGVSSSSPAKTKGCCANGTAKLTIPMNCTGTSDDADVFIRIDQPDANACVPYKVDYHY